MASSRKRPKSSARRGAARAPRALRADPARAVRERLAELGELRGRRIAVAVSGGVDSVVLLHALRGLAPTAGIELCAAHVHHGLSANADAWARFVGGLCRRWKIPCVERRVAVARKGRGVEAAAREARYAALADLDADVIALAHQLDDQAETVLLNLLRGAGVRGASAMRTLGVMTGTRGRKLLWRPLLGVPREAIEAYARSRRLSWAEDESNRSDALRRNFIRRRVAPLLAMHYPRWREALARAAAHFADAAELLDEAGAGEERLSLEQLRRAGPAAARHRLRRFLAAQGLRPPSARKLAEMARQLLASPPSAKLAIHHDGGLLRVHRGQLAVVAAGAGAESPARFEPVAWRGEPQLELPALGGTLAFRRVRGDGISAKRLAGHEVTIDLRRGGERLQPDARRPRRTLKNLFQESGIPMWQRRSLPMLYCGRMLVWCPELGVDAAFRASGAEVGLLPQWRRTEAA